MHRLVAQIETAESVQEVDLLQAKLTAITMNTAQLHTIDPVGTSQLKSKSSAPAKSTGFIPEPIGLPPGPKGVPSVPEPTRLPPEPNWVPSVPVPKGLPPEPKGVPSIPGHKKAKSAFWATSSMASSSSSSSFTPVAKQRVAPKVALARSAPTKTNSPAVQRAQGSQTGYTNA